VVHLLNVTLGNLERYQRIVPVCGSLLGLQCRELELVPDSIEFDLWGVVGFECHTVLQREWVWTQTPTSVGERPRPQGLRNPE
jgi:hypothetical protein